MKNEMPSINISEIDGNDLEVTSASKEHGKYSLVTDEAMRRRQIHLVDEITDQTFEQVKHLYDELIEEDASAPIHIIIGSLGGDVRSMLGIMNLILLSSTPCYTYILGETCSAGSWIYLCGHKRFAPKTNLISFMLHPMEWGSSSDSLGNHNSTNGYVKKLCQHLNAFTAKQTTISKEKIRKMATNETQYFVGDELFKYRIATDELINVSFWITPKPEKKKHAKKQEPVSQLLTD